jgi:hypothetical protein
MTPPKPAVKSDSLRFKGDRSSALGKLKQKTSEASPFKIKMDQAVPSMKKRPTGQDRPDSPKKQGQP